MTQIIFYRRSENKLLGFSLSRNVSRNRYFSYRSQWNSSRPKKRTSLKFTRLTKNISNYRLHDFDAAKSIFRRDHRSSVVGWRIVSLTVIMWRFYIRYCQSLPLPTAIWIWWWKFLLHSNPILAQWRKSMSMSSDFVSCENAYQFYI